MAQEVFKQPQRICCAIVEPRKHKALKFVLHNVHQVLPECQIHLFHGTSNSLFAYKACDDMRDHMIFHNLGKKNLSLTEYNKMLTNKPFYEHFKTEYVLIFQTDSMLFAQSLFEINDFLGYDYVGAPWKWVDQKKPGGNGGLSLRKVKAFIDILEKHEYPLAVDVAEDLFFASLPLHFAPFELAQRFSVESVWYPTPFACHKPWHYLKAEEYIQLQKYAPNLKVLFDMN